MKGKDGTRRASHARLRFRMRQSRPTETMSDSLGKHTIPFAEYYLIVFKYMTNEA